LNKNFVYDIIPIMINENRNISFLILTNCINKIFDVFMTVFVISFMFNHSENVEQIGTYNIIRGLVVGLLAYLTGSWLKRGGRLLMYKIGILTTFVFMCAFALFSDVMVQHIVLFGTLYGVMLAFKSFPNNLIRAEYISRHNLIKFQGYNEAAKNIVNIAAPVVLGFFLTMNSYLYTIEFLAFLSLIEFIVFSQIKIKKQQTKKHFEFKKLLMQLRTIPFFKYVKYAEFCRGLTVDGALGTLITIYAVLLFKTDLNLGIMGACFYAISIALGLLFTRICKSHYFAKILLFSGFMSILSILVFVVMPHMAPFVFYNLCFSVALMFVRIIGDINIIKTSYLPKISSQRVEFFALREIILGVGRVLGYDIMVLVCVLGNILWLKYLLLCLTVFLMLACINCARVSNLFNNK